MQPLPLMCHNIDNFIHHLGAQYSYSTLDSSLYYKPEAIIDFC